ncbi:hypothetical protein D1007_18769 [Hordeum vulgare]|nr:hypothetical protein D1007_18769 [Hordeum vulgare]
MVPKGKKGKAVASSVSTASVGPALTPSCISKAEDLVPLLPLMTEDENEWGVTTIWLGSTVPSSLVKSAYPFFLHNIYVELVSPFSVYFYVVLPYYQIQALHLRRTSVLLLAVFAFYCEAFMGVRPLVPLFCHFFSLRYTAQGQRSAFVSFVDVMGAGSRLKAMKKVEGYRNDFIFMDVCRESSLLATPLSPPEQTLEWSHKKLTDPRARPILERIAFLV